jgi:glucosyl-3-phosphoglycerate synthase
MKLSIVIPAYNEALSISHVLKVCNEANCAHEIIVVDDGSTDHTAQMARDSGATIVETTPNRGKASAMNRGAFLASGDVVMFLDADLDKLVPEQIQNLYAPVVRGESDISIGTYTFPCFQSFTKTVYEPLMSLLFPEVLDFIRKGWLSGQRCLTRELLNRLSLGEGFAVETAMNIQITFLQPRPKLAIVDLGDIGPRVKPPRISMLALAETILDEADRYNRTSRIVEARIVEIVRGFSELLDRRCAKNPESS